MWTDANRPPRGRVSGNDGAGGYANMPTERVSAGRGHGGTLGPGEPTDPSTQPPPYPQAGPQYPGGRPPQWPGPGYQAPPAAPPPAYPPQPQPPYAAPASRPREYADRDYAPRSSYRPEAGARRSRGVSLPHLPSAHLLLALGVAAMAYAIGQSWGTDASGAQVFVHDFTNARLAHRGIDAGALAVNAAIAITAAVGVLGGVLILLNTVVLVLNKMLGFVGLSGCASLVFLPVLWGAAALLFVALLGAAGFAGLGFLSQLPVVQDHGLGTVNIQQHGLGFYLWVGGSAVAFVGTLGELAARRR
ncbi:MAG TPA: hypothetical protein VE258_16790 [Ktedonobacterales bacterium]|nr:hypothetical protein [Ktedonobacterales bacterium]